jgi:hypothetical protein
MDKTTKDPLAGRLNKQQLAYVQQLRRFNRQQNAKRATDRVLQVISPFYDQKRREDSKPPRPGRQLHANNVPGPLSCGPTMAQIGLQVPPGMPYGSGSSKDTTHGPLAYTDSAGDEFYKWAARTDTASGEVQISIAAVTENNFAGMYEGENLAFGVHYNTASAGFTQLFSAPANTYVATLAATARLTAPQVLPYVGIRCVTPTEAYPSDLTVAVLTGSCTVTVSPAEVVVGGRSANSVTEDFLDLQGFANSTGYNQPITYSALDTPATATNSQFPVSGLQGFLDVTAGVTLPSPLSGTFIVDVDIALTCSYYTSNNTFWAAGAYADLQNENLEIPPLPRSLFPVPQYQDDSSITVAQILLCGEELARPPPPPGVRAKLTRRPR